MSTIEEFYALQMNENIGLEGMQLNKCNIPKLKPGEILVKIEQSPINPADIATTQGNYLVDKTLPQNIGMEGSGTVVQTNSWQSQFFLQNKKVSIVFDQKNQYSGTWGQQCVTTDFMAQPIPSDISFKQASCVYANPCTCYCMYQRFNEVIPSTNKNTKVIIQSAAAGAIGKMIDRQFRHMGVVVINVVRKDCQVEILQKQSGNINLQTNLNSADENFEQKLKSEIEKQSKSQIVFFDAVAGDVASIIFKNLPKRSVMISQGGLSGKNYEQSQKDTVFNGKKIEGFHVGSYIRDKGMQFNLKMIKEVFNNLNTIFKTDVSKIVPVDKDTDLVKLRDDIRHQKKNMTDGKLLLKFGKDN